MGKELKILLVEDNAGDAFIMEESLAEIPDYSFNITKTETLKESVSKLRETNFDVVLLDLGLPDSNGLTAVESILELQLSFPIVVITGLDDNVTGNKAVEMGAQSYMVKGQFTSNSIFQTIQYSIERTKFLERIKANEAELAKKNKALEEVISSKNMLISIISHDLRGPLNSIVSLLELINDEFDEIDSASKKKYLNSILKSANNTRDLMENLLEWAQVESNRKKAQPENIAVKNLMNESTAALEQMAAQKEIELDVIIPEDISVFADKKMITAVIRNLVSNALKFTPRGGQITVSAEPENNQKINFKIEDTGVGMEKETVTTLFELEKTTSTKGTEDESGTGFGLILCKEFIEKNGGKMNIESKKGEGTTVSFSLPYRSPSFRN